MEDRHAHGNGMRGRGTPTPTVRRSPIAAVKPRSAILGAAKVQGGKIRLVPEVKPTPEPQKKVRRMRLLRARTSRAGGRPKQAKQRLAKAKRVARRVARGARIRLWPTARRTGNIALAIYMGLVSAGVVQLLSQQLNHASYTLDAKSSKLLGATPSDFLAKKLSYDVQQQQYLFNPNYKPDANAISVGEGQFSATLGQDLRQKGFSVTDPASQISVTLTPEFNSLPGQQQNGRVVYPLYDGSQVVYTVRANGLKEDIVLPSYSGDTQEFSYTLSLPTGLEARLLSNGGIGIYSADPSLYGNISYGSDKDRALVQKARASGEKTNLVFGIPAPEITEQSGASKATATFILKGNKLTVRASNLKKASYPLSIDPSLVDTGATTFASGGAAPIKSSASNADSNIAFVDSTNTAINPAGNTLTNGTVSTFASAGTTTATNYNTATAVYKNVIYNIVPSASSASGTAVYYTTINSSGTVNAWTATASLSTALNITAAVIENGYLYVVGGYNGTPVKTVEYAPICTGVNVTTGLAANCVTGSTEGTLGSWTTTTSLNTARAGTGVYAYNNHIYAFGGQTTSTPTATNTVEYATLNTDGSVASWTTSGNNLPANNMDFGYAGYNGYVYTVGGTSDGGTTITSNTYYAKLLSDGTIGPWSTTTSLPANRYGLTAAITNGYMYAMGGVQTAAGAVQSTTYYASVNADGSIGVWNTTTSESTGLAFSSTALFNDAIYNVAGCTTYNCTSFTNVIPRAVPNAGGAANLLAARQTGATFPIEHYSSGSDAGKYAHMSAVLNGYLYVMGGCEVYNGDATCDTNRFSINNLTSQSMFYAKISATDGTVGTWSTASNGLPGNGLAASGITVHNNTIFLIGGVAIYNFLNFTTSWQTSGFYVTVSPSTGNTTAGWTSVANVLPQLSADGSGWLSATYINGNIYVAGGCRGTSGLSCSNYTGLVCRIPITNDVIPAGGGTGTPSCVTTGQTQLTTVLGSSTTLLGSGATGIANMGSAYGGGYLYLMGGATNARSQLRTILYAQLDPVNGITGAWHIATATMLYSTNGGTATNDGVRDVSAAYANGQLLAFGGYNGNGSLSISSIVSVCAITPSTGDVASCTASGTAMSATRWGSAAAYANGYVYDTGGCSGGPADTGCTNGTTMSAAVDIFRLNYGGSGTVNAWTAGSSSIGTARYMLGMAAANGHLYLLGGCTDTSNACGTPVSTVMIGTIGAATDTSRVSWASSTSLPAARGGIGVVVKNGYLYALGGYNGSSASNYYYAKLAGDGSIITNGVTACSGGAVTWCSASMPASIATFGTATANGKIYVGGGLDSTGAYVATVFIGTPSLVDGSISWASGTSFTTGRQDLGMAVYGGNLYIAGGQTTGSVFLQDIQFAPITSTTTGAIGSWSYTSNLPTPMQSFNMFAENGYLIVVGGLQVGFTLTNGTWTGSIASNGQVSAMQENVNTFTSPTWWAGGVYYDGYIYQAGGLLAANTTATNNTVYAGFGAQPAISQFSQLLDAGANVSPINMFINTSRGSISSVVNVQYSSATGPGPSTFGNNQFLFDMMDAANSVYPVSAIDASSTTLETNRYYYVFFTLDDSQSVSFPAATQVTGMSRYELFYHPNSGLRLRGGQTFSNGAATSLDAAPR